MDGLLAGFLVETAGDLDCFFALLLLDSLFLADLSLEADFKAAVTFYLASFFSYFLAAFTSLFFSGLDLDGVGAETGLAATFLEAGAIALGAGDLDLVDLLCRGSSITFLATTGLLATTG